MGLSQGFVTVDCNSGKAFVFGFFRKLLMGSASAIIGGPKHIISCNFFFYSLIMSWERKSEEEKEIFKNTPLIIYYSKFYHHITFRIN